MVGEDACLDLPVGKAGTEWERDIFVHGLKSLEDERVTGRGGFNAVRESYIDDVNKEGQRKESDPIIVAIGVGKKVGAVGEHQDLLRVYLGHGPFLG